MAGSSQIIEVYGVGAEIAPVSRWKQVVTRDMELSMLKNHHQALIIDRLCRGSANPVVFFGMLLVNLFTTVEISLSARIHQILNAHLPGEILSIDIGSGDKVMTFAIELEGLAP